MLPLQHFQQFIEQHGLFNQGDKILLAVSGGRDSVLMANLFHKSGYSFGIAHCNFNLRRPEADMDEKFTKDLATEFNCAFHSTRFDTEKYAGENKISIQMAARDLRYQWLERMRNEHNYDYIAFAHHQTDNVETILLNLVRGTGLSGLHGIRLKRNKIVRPLMFLTREEVDQIVAKEGITFRDDESNFSPKYARNKLRLEVLPTLKTLNPALEQTFTKNVNHFTAAEDFIDLSIAKLYQRVMESDESKTRFKVHLLGEEYQSRFVFYELLKSFNFNEATSYDIFRTHREQPGKQFYSRTHIALLDRGEIIITELRTHRQNEILIDATDNLIAWNGDIFNVQISSAMSYSLQKNNSIAQLDFESLRFPLKFRQWSEGDIFCPLGMNGRKKKISDFFISQKIPLTEKKRIGILENGNGDILWIQNYRIDERYKISKSSQKVFILEQQTT